MSTYTYNELSQSLAAAGCHAEAPECQATLAGLISAGPLPDDWIAHITGGGDSLDDCREALEKLRDTVAREMAGEQLEFDLLLPDDEADLAERTDALAHWCQGFLYGLTVGGISADKAMPDDVAEVVSDFAKLTEAEHSGDSSEDDERNYFELCEYVRVGAQLVYEELSARPIEKS
ncbi:MAG: UPF0149 family protein [Gammaproteobacteria bacterium]|nr:UPF0149 family protein [Gammaproteobacteria bacterium]